MKTNIQAVLIIFGIIYAVMFLPAVIFMSDSLHVAGALYKPQPYFMDEACEEFTCVSSLSAAAACEAYVEKYHIPDGMLMCENYEKSLALDYAETSCCGTFNKLFDWDAHWYWIKIGGWVYIAIIAYPFFLAILVEVIHRLIMRIKRR